MEINYDEPEGLMGILLAFEGVKDAETILNGPTGCKFHPSSVSESVYRRKGSFNPMVFSGEFHFCQPRIPCTYLGGYDYITGSKDRLNRLFEEISSSNPRLIGIVNSPGASLIGESLNVSETSIPVVKIETPAYSRSMGEGFQEGVISILEKIKPSGTKRKGCINLLGISVWHLNWEDSINDLSALLNLCGIEVISSAGAGWSVNDILSSGEAELNVIIHDEFGSKIGNWYKENCNIPFISPEVPIGFDALESWLKEVCSILGKDVAPALEVIRSKRKKVFRELLAMDERKALPKGRTFSIAADGSLAFPILRFLYEYLGMVPVAVNVEDQEWNRVIGEYLSNKGLTASENVSNIAADIFIGDGNTLSSLLFRDIVRSGIVVESPGIRQIEIRDEPVLGLNGTLRLLDGVLNSLIR